MVLRDRLYTIADLRTIAGLPENADRSFELLRGVIYAVPTGTPLHAWIILTLGRLIANFVVEHNLGYVFADSIQYDLPNGDSFIPDVSFVSKQRYPTLPDQFDAAPDLAVEVASPSNSERGLLDKVESYLESGTRRVWVVYPEAKLIDVFRLTPDGSLLKHKYALDSVIDGEDILPGFELAVRDVFPQE
jgi:Uma2 family endonuclease